MITLTESAQKNIRRQLLARGTGHGIKIGVKTTGCNGLAYVIEYQDDPSLGVGTQNYIYQDFSVTVAQADMIYLDGLTLDWQRTGLNQGYKFINPNARGHCGCGESFRI